MGREHGCVYVSACLRCALMSFSRLVFRLDRDPSRCPLLSSVSLVRVPLSLSFVASVSVSRSLAIAVPSVALSTHQLIGHEPKLALVKELRRVVDGTCSVRVCRRGSRGVEQAAGRQGTRPASEVVSEVVQEHDSDCCIGRALRVESKGL